MQEKNFTELLRDADLKFDSPVLETRNRMGKLSVKNFKDLSFKDVTHYLRGPTTDDLVEMRQWAIDYKKANKSASKRQVRKATQEYFKVKIYR